MGRTAKHRGVKLDRVLVGVVARFAAAFLVLAGAIIAIDSVGGWRSSRLALATTVTRLSGATGVAAVQAGTLIRVPGRTLSIDLACTAIFIVALYVALIAAYPVSKRARLVGIAIGVPVIIAFNVARVVGAAEVAQFAPSAFGFVHDYVFEVAMMLLTVGLWAGWLSYARADAR